MRKSCLNNDISFVHRPVGCTLFIVVFPLHKLSGGVGIAYVMSVRISNRIIDVSECGTLALIIKIYGNLFPCFGVIFGNVIIHIRLIGNNAVKGVFFNPCFSGMKELIFEVKEHTAHFSEALKACGFPCGSVADIYKTVCIRKTLISIFTQLIHKVHILNVINYPADKGCVGITNNSQSCITAVEPAAKFHLSIARKNVCNL